jgi:hypothetical protein
MDVKIRYIFHYDELTWLPKIIERPFNEIKIPYMGREHFVNWINDNIESHVYVWSGVLTPTSNSINWGHLVSPSEETSFLIFTNDGDQTRYALEFVGGSTIHVKTYKNGVDAYYSRKK